MLLLEDQKIFLEELGIDPDNVTRSDVLRLWEIHDKAEGTEASFTRTFIRELVKRI